MDKFFFVFVIINIVFCGNFTYGSCCNRNKEKIMGMKKKNNNTKKKEEQKKYGNEEKDEELIAEAEDLVSSPDKISKYFDSISKKTDKMAYIKWLFPYCWLVEVLHALLSCKFFFNFIIDDKNRERIPDNGARQLFDVLHEIAMRLRNGFIIEMTHKLAAAIQIYSKYYQPKCTSSRQKGLVNGGNPMRLVHNIFGCFDSQVSSIKNIEVNKCVMNFSEKYFLLIHCYQRNEEIKKELSEKNSVMVKKVINNENGIYILNTFDKIKDEIDSHKHEMIIILVYLIEVNGTLEKFKIYNEYEKDGATYKLKGVCYLCSSNEDFSGGVSNDVAAFCLNDTWYEANKEYYKYFQMNQEIKDYTFEQLSQLDKTEIYKYARPVVLIYDKE